MSNIMEHKKIRKQFIEERLDILRREQRNFKRYKNMEEFEEEWSKEGLKLFIEVLLSRSILADEEQLMILNMELREEA